MKPIFAKRMSYSPFKTYAEHAHGETQVTLVVAGGVEEKVGSDWRTIRPFEFIIKPAGILHSNRFSGKETLTLQISLEPHIARHLGVDAVVSNYRAMYFPELMRYLLSQFLSNPGFDTNQELAPDRLTKLLRCVRPNNRQRIQPPSWLASAYRNIETGFCNQIALKDLAKSYDLHPVSMARAFRRQYGQSVKEFVGQLRVQRAAKQLAETNQSAAEIALECGFSDQSHMNRVFKSISGVPPVQFRKWINGQSR